jgi:hypothetical protein
MRMWEKNENVRMWERTENMREKWECEKGMGMNEIEKYRTRDQERERAIKKRESLMR